MNPNKGVKNTPANLFLLTAQKLMLVGFLLRIFVAIWNGFFGPSFGGEADAITLHNIAVDYANNLVLGEFKIGIIYSYVLGIFYYVTTDSIFLGSLLSCVVWLLSAILIMRIMQLMSFNALHRFRAMLVYALLPSSILFTSVTLREAYQLMFVNLAIYSALKILLDKSAGHWLFLLCGVVVASMLHLTFLGFGLFVVIATWFMHTFREGKGFPFTQLILVVPLVVATQFYGFSLLTTIYNPYVLQEGLDKAIVRYLQGGFGMLDDGRAFYKTSVEINGMSGLLSFIPVSLFQYLFEPMPWRIATLADVELFFENVLRAWLIWKASVGLWNMPAHGRKPVLFIFLSYLVIETIWSLGTINWGTAVRHHIPGMGMLLVAGFAFSKTRSSRTGRH